jgi:hypothetical protein
MFILLPGGSSRVRESSVSRDQPSEQTRADRGVGEPPERYEPTERDVRFSKRRATSLPFLPFINSTVPVVESPGAGVSLGGGARRRVAVRVRAFRLAKRPERDLRGDAKDEGDAARAVRLFLVRRVAPSPVERRARLAFALAERDGERGDREQRAAGLRRDVRDEPSSFYRRFVLIPKKTVRVRVRF